MVGMRTAIDQMKKGGFPVLTRREIAHPFWHCCFGIKARAGQAICINPPPWPKAPGMNQKHPTRA